MNVLKQYAIALFVSNVGFGMSMGVISLDAMKALSEEQWLLGNSLFMLTGVLLTRLGLHDKCANKITRHARVIQSLELVVLATINVLTYLSTDLTIRWLIQGFTSGIMVSLTTMCWEQVKQNSGEGRSIHALVSSSFELGFVGGMLLALAAKSWLGIQLEVNAMLLVQTLTCAAETVAAVRVMNKYLKR